MRTCEIRSTEAPTVACLTAASIAETSLAWSAVERPFAEPKAGWIVEMSGVVVPTDVSFVAAYFELQTDAGKFAAAWGLAA